MKVGDVAKGYLCKLCGTHTVQPQSTNRFKCSKCGTVFTRETVIAGQ